MRSIRAIATDCTAMSKDTSTVPATSMPQLEQASEQDKLFSKLELELRGVDPAVLKSYSWFATTAANHLGIEVGNW